MTFDEYMALLDEDSCPETLPDYLQALWHDHRGDWDRAHEIVQTINDRKAARIHAYLHRKEGDDWNSRYWHRQAGTEFRSDVALEEEWRELVEAMLI